MHTLAPLADHELAGQSLQTASAVVMHAKALNQPAVQAVHGEQALASVTVEYEVPGVQSVQTALVVDVQAEKRNLPAVHMVHAMQAPDALAPVVLENVPVPQAVHVALDTARTAVEKVPAWQDVHWALVTAPGLDWYFPASQAMHAALEEALFVLL